MASSSAPDDYAIFRTDVELLSPGPDRVKQTKRKHAALSSLLGDLMEDESLLSATRYIDQTLGRFSSLLVMLVICHVILLVLFAIHLTVGLTRTTGSSGIGLSGFKLPRIV